MKIDNTIIEPDKISISQQKEVRKEVKFIGKLKMQRGQKVWQLDLQTRLITIANVESVSNIKGDIKRKLVVKEGCWYAPAINLKNAEKKFLKMFG